MFVVFYTVILHICVLNCSTSYCLYDTPIHGMCVYNF